MTKQEDMKQKLTIKEKNNPGVLSIPIEQGADQKKRSKPFSYWLKKNWYYHQRVINFYRFHISAGFSILQINCKNGYLLDALKPSFAVGIDDDHASIAQAREQYPVYAFHHGPLAALDLAHQFDYIILSLATMEVDDIQTLFYQLHRFCHPGTRIIIESYSYLWAPILWLTEKLGLRRPTQFKNWISRTDLQNFLYLAGFDHITSGAYVLMPKYVPLLSWFCNDVLVHVPFVRWFCLQQWMVMRPVLTRGKPLEATASQPTVSQVSVSVVIPCRNEKGNVEAAARRCPQMGARTEIIFVEGNSTDDTLDEIERVAQAYPEKNIRWYVQDGKGKGDAVRKGFAHARGDVLMILDADLTMPPEELPKFFDALVSGKGEFINGSRLVYGMESQAMTTSAYLANCAIGFVVSWMVVGQRVKDTLCGTKVLWKKDYDNIAAGRSSIGLHDPFGDFDLLFGAARLNLKIVDMPVRYKARVYGKSNIARFKDVWLLWWMGVQALMKFKR